MKSTLTVGPSDSIKIDDEWGYPMGLIVGDMHIIVQGRALDEMIASLEAVRREREDMQREADGEPTEAEHFSNAGTELAGFESAVV